MIGTVKMIYSTAVYSIQNTSVNNLETLHLTEFNNLDLY